VCQVEEKSDDSKDSLMRKLINFFYHFLKFHMKILVGGFNAKVGRENIFKPTIGNESLRQVSKDNGDKIVKFVTVKYLVVKSKKFPHRDS
jgi:hypothetical protein